MSRPRAARTPSRTSSRSKFSDGARKYRARRQRSSPATPSRADRATPSPQRGGFLPGVIAMSPARWWNDSTAVVQYAMPCEIAQPAAHLRQQRWLRRAHRRHDQALQRAPRLSDSRRRWRSPSALRRTDSHGLTPAPSRGRAPLRLRADVHGQLPIKQLGPSSDSAAVVKAIWRAKLLRPGARLFGEPETLPKTLSTALATESCTCSRCRTWRSGFSAATPRCTRVGERLRQPAMDFSRKVTGRGYRGVPARRGRARARASRHIAQSRQASAA